MTIPLGGRPGPLGTRRGAASGWPRRLGLAGLAATLALPQGATGQEDGPPGIRLTFGLSQGIEADTNLDLDPDSEGTTVQAVTGLGFGVLSRTPISTLELAADASLRLADGPDVGDGLIFDGPVLSFEYEREVPSSSFALDGSVRQDEVAFLDLGEFVTDEGVLEVPPDFEDFEGEGTRRSADLDAALSVRDDRPFGLALTAGVRVVDYQDVTSPELEDSVRTSFGTVLRFTLTPVAELRVGFSSTSYDEDGEDDDEVVRSLDVGGSIDRPRGPLSAALSLDDTEEGLRTAVSFGRSLALPTGGLSASLGATRAAAGDVNLTGDLSFNRDLPRGAITVSLAQAVINGDDFEEELVTTVAAGYRRDLTPVASLSLDALYSGRRATETDDTDQALELGAALGYQLTRDWGLSVGYRHRLRDESVEGRADSDSVFLTVGRTFERGL